MELDGIGADALDNRPEDGIFSQMIGDFTHSETRPDVTASLQHKL
jgi:hypothetical protein